MIQPEDDHSIMLPVSPRDHIRGLLSAPVTLVQYGDYACSDSRKAYDIIRDNRQHFGPDLCFVFRHFPVRQIHPQAQHAAEAAEAAGAQGKFWEMHDSLFAHQPMLDNGYLVEYANTLGLDTMQFLRSMAQHTYAERVHEDFSSGLLHGVHGTPAFFIDGVRHEGLWNVETLLAAVDSAAHI